MARSVRAPIEARSRRLRLEARKEPYWCTIERGLSVGYHRPAGGGAGTWWARVLVSSKPTRYRSAALAHADDHADADDSTVLDWKQAQARARAWAAKQTGSGPLTIGKVIERYIADLGARKGERAAKLTEGRLRKHALPVLGDVLVSDLTADQVRAWLKGVGQDRR